MGKLKVLHLIESLGSGGAEKLLYTNLTNFDNDRIESRVITVFSRDNYWKEPIEGLGVAVSSLNCTSMRDIARGTVRLLKILQKSRPDLIHTHLWTANIIGRIAGQLAGIPVISSIHNPEYEPEVFTDAAKLTKTKLFSSRILDKVTTSFRCDRMIAVSNFVKESASKRIGYPSEKIDVLYNPIENSELTGRRRREETLGELGLPLNSLVILNVGRVSPQKGLIYAIRSMREILTQFPTAHLLSVGGQNDKTWLSVIRNEIRELNLTDKVSLLGERRDVPDILASADVFVFPSLFEGLGIAIAEAMATRLACVASDTGPIPEFVENGINGILVPPREPKEIAKKVCELLGDADLRKKLGEKARTTALELFEPKAAAEALMEIYYAVAERRVVRDN